MTKRGNARRKQRARLQNASVDRIRVHEHKSIFRIVPADGTTAATVRNGDFGTSPFFEQLSDKPQLACTYLCGLSDAKHNSGSRN
jgi:hypothetical protein